MIVLHFDSTHDSWFILTSCCIKNSLSLDMTFSFLFGAIRAKYSCLLYKVNYGGYVLSQTMNISFSSLKFTDQSDNGRLQDNMKRLLFFFFWPKDAKSVVTESSGLHFSMSFWLKYDVCRSVLRYAFFWTCFICTHTFSSSLFFIWSCGLRDNSLEFIEIVTKF